MVVKHISLLSTHFLLSTFTVSEITESMQGEKKKTTVIHYSAGLLNLNSIIIQSQGIHRSKRAAIPPLKLCEYSGISCH
jgi:hypothetical protein